MANLIIPDKTRHQYVVGIDIGHGETSAAIVPIEWDKSAGQRESDFQDIDLDSKARKKVITSAICIDVKDAVRIGDQAFEHMTDNRGLRVCFKQKPHDINGEAEKLMIQFMKCVYGRILESQVELTKTNHIVYLARPSGWVEEEAKELYKQMAIEAGIPLAGLTSESRAAIFYAKTPRVAFTNAISKGAIVFDLGSSTLDFTFLSDHSQPIDYGYNLGASIIDTAILDNMILANDEAKEFLTKYPEYRDALKFKARKFKEDAYSRDEELKTVGSFNLGTVIPDTEESYDTYEDTYIKLKIANLAELNTMVENITNYMSELKNAMVDFKENKIPGNKVFGVFLTGGASRMNFIRPMIAEAFELPVEDVRIDSDNPSLTISRGIAMLGATDAITSVLVTELKKKTSAIVDDNKLITDLTEALSENIANKVWGEVDTACSDWVRNGSGTDPDDLKRFVEKKLNRMQKNGLQKTVNDTLQSYIDKKSEEIRKSMNEIISLYAPDREISISSKAKLGNMDEINQSLSDLTSTISSVCDNLTNIVADILWAALGVFLWGVLCAPYYIWKALRSDESKRRDKVEKVLEKKYETLSNIKNGITSKLRDNDNFKKNIVSALNNYFNNLIESNLRQVMIPIE